MFNLITVNKLNNNLSIINIIDCIFIDIKYGREVQLFDVNNILNKLTFKEGLLLNKYFYSNNLIEFKKQLILLRFKKVNDNKQLLSNC